ncbi:unnamed protein product [Calicophoron daubneyi]|uniref:Peptidase M14 domain-containing protein n=1 Tax=Calicophoron daubneyi TaxID=300641 RepID=A0AAV2TL92_CALDB
MMDTAHKFMHLNETHCNEEKFPLGIVNGNNWYPVYGGMQDWNYLDTGCMELTLEIGCPKYPEPASIVKYWEENKYALIVFVAQVHRALKGFVMDGPSGKPVGTASIHVLGNSHLVRTTDYGEYWRILPELGVFSVWVSKSGYFPSANISVNASELPYVRETSSEQLNFTLWPDRTSEWSDSIDYGILENRIPVYFDYSNYQSKLKSTVSGTPLRLVEIKPPGGPDSIETLLGVEVTIAGQATRRRKIELTSAPRALPGRIRVLLLAGTTVNEILSVEMALRLVRHYAKGLEVLDENILYLRSMQIVIVPCLDSQNLNNASNHDRKPSRYGLEKMIEILKPHLVITLESGDWSHSWKLEDQRTSAPLLPLYLPNASAVSMKDLFSDLTLAYMTGADLPKNQWDCNKFAGGSSTESTDHLRTAHEELIEILSGLPLFSVDNETSRINSLPPIAVAIKVSCASPQRPPAQALPEVWHYTLRGLTNLFSAIRNLSFCGQLLVESNRLVPALMAAHHWEPSPSARIFVRTVFFFKSKSSRSEKSTANEAEWFAVPVDPTTGLFGSILPSGTFLIFASAGPNNMLSGQPYEEVGVTIFMRSDRRIGLSRIRLERQLTRIVYSGPGDLVEHMRRYTSDLGVDHCGTLTVIGKSAQGKPIYLFTLGAGISSVPANVSGQNTSEEIDLLSVDDPVNNRSDFSAVFPTKLVLFGNLDGQDSLTPQLLVHFIQWLCENRGSQTLTAKIMSSVQIAIIPIPDPDELFKSWRSPMSDLVGANDHCLPQENVSHTHSKTPNGGITKLWQEFINFTIGWKRRSHPQRKPERPAESFPSPRAEIKAIIQWLNKFQPNAILSFPTGLSPDISYHIDESETEYARELFSDVNDWLRFLGYLLAPGFRRDSLMCLSNPVHSSSAFKSRENDLDRISSLTMEGPNAVKKNSQTGMIAQALAISSQISLADATRRPKQREPSPSPLSASVMPTSLGLSLCPACLRATSLGVARIWHDYHFPSLLLGLIGHTTLAVPGSCGVVGQVLTESDKPVPWTRIHLDNVLGEITTGDESNNGYFSIPLPPGTFKFSFMAEGFLDYSELIRVDPIKGPTYHVVHLTPVSGLTVSTRTYIMAIAGSLVAGILCVATIWLCYRFCCRARTSYAVARRAVGSHTSGTKLNVSNDASRGAYRLLPLNSEERSETDCGGDESRQAMLQRNANDDEDYEDSGEFLDNEAENGGLRKPLKVLFSGGKNKGPLSRGFRKHHRGRRTRLTNESPRHTSQAEEDGLEEVDLV